VGKVLHGQQMNFLVLCPSGGWKADDSAVG